MSMNWIWCPNHNQQHIACEKPSESPIYCHHEPWGETKHIYQVGGGILMTTSHRRRCWNTLYMYEADLRWVWIGWVASIITYNMIHLMLVNARPRPPWHWETWFSVWVQSTCTWPLSTSNVCQTFDINWTWNECDKVIGMSQPQHMVYPSHHNHCHSHSHSSKF